MEIQFKNSKFYNYYVPKITLTSPTISRTLDIPSPFRSAAHELFIVPQVPERIQFASVTISKTLKPPSPFKSPNCTQSRTEYDCAYKFAQNSLPVLR